MLGTNLYRNPAAWYWQGMITLLTVCFFGSDPSSPVMAQDSIEGSTATTDTRSDNLNSSNSASRRSSDFSRYLRDSGRTRLWLDDLLARWRQTTDSAEKIRWSFELSAWLEMELRAKDMDELRRLYPQVWEGVHVQDQAFATVRLVELRQRLNKIAVVAFENSLRESVARMEGLEQIQELQRELRAAVQTLTQLTGDVSTSNRSLQSLQLQPWREAAQASLAWSFYYEWLLTPTDQAFDLDRLRQSRQLFMQVLGTTEPDVLPADWYRWFDPTRATNNDLLLGFGLCGAALDQTDVASTSFATLQRQNDPLLSQRVVLWHAQNLLKRGRWDDAPLLVANHFQSNRTKDPGSMAALVETMLRWLSDPPSPAIADSPTTPVVADDPDRQRIAVWKWRVLETLVLGGRVDQAAALMSKYSATNPGAGLASQVMLLHPLLSKQPLSSRSPQQLAQLSERLQLWATTHENFVGNKPPREIQRWAQQWLIQVRLANGDIEDARALMNRVFEETPLEENALRQELAWNLAQTYEGIADVDENARQACILWYREAASQPNLPKTATARIKTRLWELAGQPLAQTAYLQSVSSSDEGYLFARRQLILRVYEDFRLMARDNPRKKVTAAMLEREVVAQLGIPQQLFSAEISTTEQWQDRTTQQLRKLAEQGQDSSAAALVSVWLQSMDSTTSETVTLKRNAVLAACVGHAMTGPQDRLDSWRPVLYLAAVDWEQNSLLAGEASLRQQVLEYLLGGTLTPLETQSLLSRIVPERRRQWEQEWKVPESPAIVDEATIHAETTTNLRNFYRHWWEAMQAGGSATFDNQWLSKVQLDYAEFLWRIDEHELAKQVLMAHDSSPNHGVWQRQMARVLSQADPSTAGVEAEKLWVELAERFPQGSQDWFEAKYYLLRSLAQRDPVQARLGYQQLRQLYPELPTPWPEAYSRLAAQYQW